MKQQNNQTNKQNQILGVALAFPAENKWGPLPSPFVLTSHLVSRSLSLSVSLTPSCLVSLSVFVLTTLSLCLCLSVSVLPFLVSLSLVANTGRLLF